MSKFVVVMEARAAVAYSVQIPTRDLSMKSPPSTSDDGVTYKHARFAIKAARVQTGTTFTGVTFEDLDLEIQGVPPEEAERLIKRLLETIEAKGEAAPAQIDFHGERPRAGVERPNEEVKIVRDRMKELGLNQTDLAKKAGIYQSHLSMIMRGLVGLSAKNRRKIFEALGLSQANPS